MLDISDVINVGTLGLVLGRILLHHKFVLDFIFLRWCSCSPLHSVYVFKIVTLKIMPECCFRPSFGINNQTWLVCFRFEGHIEICPPGMSNSTYSVNKSVLEAIKARLSSFHELLLEPPKVSETLRCQRIWSKTVTAWLYFSWVSRTKPSLSDNFQARAQVPSLPLVTFSVHYISLWANIFC